MKNSYPLRFLRLFFGLFLCATSVVIAVQSNMGVSPWDVFHQGIAQTVGITMGQACIWVGVGIILIAALLKETLGAGTFCNMFCVGLMMDAIAGLNLIPKANGYVTGIAMMLLSVVVVAFGSYFYISSGMGCGPRDSMMSALTKRLPKVPVGVIRASIEGAAILCGWLLGGQAGVGTIVAMFGVGVAIQYVFAIFKFDLKSVRHETLLYTLRHLFAKAEEEVLPLPAVEAAGEAPQA